MPMIATPMGKVVVLGQGGAGLLPFSEDFARADGALGNGWNGATWTIVSGKAVNAPTLGAELIVNGGFASDTVWNKGGGWTIAAGVGHHTNGSLSRITQSVLTTNVWTSILWTIAAYSGSGGIQAEMGAPSNLSPAQRTTTGAYTDTGRVTGAVAGVQANGNAIIDIDDYSAKAITVSTMFATQPMTYNHADVSAIGTILPGTQCGMVVNLDNPASPANFVIGWHDGTNIRLEKCVAGTYTTLITTTVAVVAGVLPRVVRPANTDVWQLWYNGSQVGADQPIADAAILAATNHGMMITAGGNAIDSITIAPSA